MLYALMGIAAWLVWRCGGFRNNQQALTLFLVQLALNALWSWLFFAWHRGVFAFTDIVVLWLFIAATLVSFWRVRPLAGACSFPIYCGSVSQPYLIIPFGNSTRRCSANGTNWTFVGRGRSADSSQVKGMKFVVPPAAVADL